MHGEAIDRKLLLADKHLPSQISLNTMILISILFMVRDAAFQDCGFSDLLDGFRRISKSPVMLGEILELLYYKYDKIDFVDEPVQVDYACPWDNGWEYN